MGQTCNGLSLGIPAAKKGKLTWEKIDDYDDAPDFAEDFIGYLIAVGGSGIDGIPCLEPFRVDNLVKKYATSIKRASKRWERFAKWCARQGIILPPAEIWLVETETA